jgi:hypothetical protein
MSVQMPVFRRCIARSSKDALRTSMGGFVCVVVLVWLMAFISGPGYGQQPDVDQQELPPETIEALKDQVQYFSTVPSLPPSPPVGSANNGLTFGPVVNAAVDSFEAPFFLGPFASFFRWWPTMMPDIEIGSDGVAHIAYAHDPVPQLPPPGTFNPSPEDGDIRYVTSAGPPYTTWSTPMTISDDQTGQAQGFPALETAIDGGGSFAQVAFVDHRLTPPPPIPPNILFDIFYTRATGDFWSPSARVTDQSSVSDFDFIGDYNDLTAGSNYSFGVWTDRRDKISFFDFEDDVWGGRIEHGLPTETFQNPLARSPNGGDESTIRSLRPR